MTFYDTIGHGYSVLRRPDPRIAAAVMKALGDATSVVNVGAGAGSYEPAHDDGRTVLAVEPSEVMIRQRRGAAPCVRGSAEALPLANGSFDAAMAILSAHHWSDLAAGLGEMARVARKRIVLLTWVPDSPPFWLTQDYFPEIVAHDRTIFPDTAALTSLLERLGGRVHSAAVPVPHDCHDGFLCAYWRRPHAYLRADVRGAISSFARIDARPGLAKLHADLASGRWADRNRDLPHLEELDAGYRLVRCELGGDAEE